MYNKTEVAALLIESGANIDLQEKVSYMYSFMLMNICSRRRYGQIPVLHIYCPIIEASLSMKVYYIQQFVVVKIYRDGIKGRRQGWDGTVLYYVLYIHV